ncbi:ATP-binding protein [Actinomadura sp. HBU206391]|uniref:ATP-binding protein n=1 Tax=Actinomadura sp. HBU206391 TaxID=2731692 RepID=UPI0016501771|nr:LuxR C-terminal-related transcriptional regulator [Actinomadura sp. HBU206391]MBC6460764.1 LuxR family transcriptional regulator [Actinomadura sp. HBU206391]
MVSTRSSARWRDHGLPAEVTSFVGRRHETAAVKRLLSASRLVTLTGVGGVGKTRLAYRVAAELARAFPDGVWLAELAELENPELLTNTVSEALGIDDRPGRPALNVLAEHLRDMTALLVLDNCEHLLPECTELVETLLRNAPTLRILATSRHLLDAMGEQAFTVPALSLPGSDGDSPETSTQSDAVRLFAERAQAALADFTVTAENRDAVERICLRLDGLPLAIELAAVRLRALSVQQLLDRLDDRFRLLERRSVVPRHRTLWALIDWSHTLCSPQERLLWARASVFVGGLNLTGAEAVCSGDGIAREDVLDLVTGLVDKSVLVTEESRLGIRYRLMESLREYGRGRLAESGEEAAVLRRYRDFYRRMCAETLTQPSGPSQLNLLARLKLENANLRSAMDYCFATPGHVADGLHMAADLRNHWLSGYLGEGRQRLAQGLALHHTPDDARGRALALDAWLAVVDGQTDVADLLDEAEQIGRRLGHGVILADVALQRGLVALDRGDAETAIRLCRDAAEQHHVTGDLMGRIRAYLWLSSALTLGGELEAAVRAAEEGIALCEVHGKGLYRAHLLTMLSVPLWRQGDTVRAGELVKEALSFHRVLGNPRGIGLNLAALAWVAAAEGRYERAARLLGIFETFSQEPRSRRALGAQVAGYRHLRRYHQQCMADIRGALGDTAFETIVGRNARLDVDQALAYAMEEPAKEEVDAVGAAGNGARWPPLTRRETEVAGLVRRGLSNKDIAAKLVISQRTAEGHVERILTKLGFGSRAQIAVWISNRENEASGRA